MVGSVMMSVGHWISVVIVSHTLYCRQYFSKYSDMCCSVSLRQTPKSGSDRSNGVHSLIWINVVLPQSSTNFYSNQQHVTVFSYLLANTMHFQNPESLPVGCMKGGVFIGCLLMAFAHLSP